MAPHADRNERSVLDGPGADRLIRSADVAIATGGPARIAGRTDLIHPAGAPWRDGLLDAGVLRIYAGTRGRWTGALGDDPLGWGP